MRFQNKVLAGYFADLLKRQQRMAQVVQNSQEKDYVERPQLFGSYFVNTQFVERYPGIQGLPGLEKILRRPTINRNDVGATLFRLKTIIAIPTTDIEYPFAS